MCRGAISFFVDGKTSLSCFHSRAVFGPMLLAALVCFCTGTISLTGCERTPPPKNRTQEKPSARLASVNLPEEQTKFLKQHFPNFVLPLNRAAPPQAIETSEPGSPSHRIIHGQPLATAVYAGNLEAAQKLIDEGHETTYTETGRTLLHGAAFNGDVEMCRLLINAGMNPNTPMLKDYQRQTAVHSAIQSGSIDTLKLMLAQGGKLEPVELSPMNGRNSPNTTPLILAIRANSPDMVDFVVQQGARVDDALYLHSALTHMFQLKARNRQADVQRARQIAAFLLRKNVPLQPRYPEQHPLLAALRAGDKAIVEQIKSRLPDEPYTFAHLKAAAESGNAELCRDIVNAGVKASKSPSTGKELMRYALIKHRKPELVDVFASAGEQNRYPEQFDVSVGYNSAVQYAHPLYHAALHGDFRFCDYLLEEYRDADGLWQPLKYEPYEYDSDIELYRKGNTPLFAAVFDDNAEVLRLLLHHGSSQQSGKTAKLDINGVNSWGETALHDAVRFGAPKCVQVLLANGANPLVANARGAMPLHIVTHTQSGHPSFRSTKHDVQSEIFPLLVAACMTQDKSKEWLNAKDKKGQTVLHQHASAGYAENCEKLIALGADVNARNARNQTSFHVALRSRLRQYPGTVRRSGRAATCALLIEQGTDVEQATAQPEERYYRVAAENNFFEVCALLETKGVGPDIQANAGPLLCAAATFGQPDRIKQYLALGGDVQAREPREQATPLHCAAGQQDVQICKLLIENGADPNARDKLGQTPAFCIFRRWATHIARFSTSDPAETEKNALATLEFLIANGADLSSKTNSTSLMDRSGTLLQVFHNLPEPFRELIDRHKLDATTFAN